MVVADCPADPVLPGTFEMIPRLRFQLSALRLKHDIHDKLDPTSSHKAGRLPVFQPLADRTDGKELDKMITGDTAVIDSVIKGVAEDRLCSA